MARPASGSEHIEAARKLLKTARTADELRLAQSVLLPLELGLSIEQTAQAIGRSSGATCTMRTRFGKVASGLMTSPRSKRELRNRANADLQRERQILDEVLTRAASGGVVVIPQIKPAIEAKLGKTLALSSVYRMLALPKRSLGSTFHWQPVRRRYTTPSNTWRAGLGGRPAPGLRVYSLVVGRSRTGINGSTRFQNSSVTTHESTRLRVAIHLLQNRVQCGSEQYSTIYG